MKGESKVVAKSFGFEERVWRLYLWVKYIQFIIWDPKVGFPQLRDSLRGVSDLSFKNLKYLGLFKYPEIQNSASPAAQEDWNPSTWRYWYPFKPLPNVRKFTIELQSFDPLFAAFGLKKRLQPITKWEPYENNRMNRYLLHQLKSMELLRYNPDVYWHKANWLSRNSITFFVQQLAETEPNWHRELPFWKIRKLYKSYLYLMKELPAPMTVTRVMIPKSATKERPLGVPSLEWRLYMGIINKFLLKYLRTKLNHSQHAYKPYHGTITAWIELFSKIFKYKYIYEFDLKGFFPNVNPEFCYEILKDNGVPERMIKILRKAYTTIPKHIDFWKDDMILANNALIRSKTKDAIEYWENIVKLQRLKYSTKGVLSMMAHPGYGIHGSETEPHNSVVMRMMMEHVTPGYTSHDYDLPVMGNYDSDSNSTLQIVPEWMEDEPIQLYSLGDCRLGGSFGKLNFFRWQCSTCDNAPDKCGLRIPTGVHQGAPCSPLIATLALERTILKDKDAIMYADDGLIFSNEEFDPVKEFEAYKRHGIHLALSKSKFIKEKGVWKSPLKFLGLVYDGAQDVFYSDTRKGAKLLFDDDKRRLMHLLHREEDPLREVSPTGRRKAASYTWKYLLEHEVFGYMQSRMYQGKWDLEGFVQNFRLTHVKGSWARQNSKKLRSNKVNVFTCSSFAANSLVHILRRERRKYRLGYTGWTK